jgi:hypothetical protein
MFQMNQMKDIINLKLINHLIVFYNKLSFKSSHLFFPKYLFVHQKVKTYKK